MSNKLKTGTMCSGIGAPEQALMELAIDHDICFSIEIDKYARQTYLANFQTEAMLEDMTKVDFSNPKLYADLICAGIPCQSFSLAGKRLGELDPRGLLFYNFYDYVKQRQPKYFLIENVKGLLSDQRGRTFNSWLELLSGSVNTHYNMFPHPDSLEYNVHWTVLNSKNFGVPQNRERVFIVGIRKDLPNTFSFPVGFPLTTRLKDILEPFVEEKYYLSDKMMEYLTTRTANFNSGKINFKSENDVASSITASLNSLDISDNIIVENRPDLDIVANLNKGGERGVVYSENSKLMSCLTATDYKQPKQIAVSETKIIGYTRDAKGKVIARHIKDEAGTIHTSSGSGGNTDQFVIEPFCVAMRGRDPKNPSNRKVGKNNSEQTLEPNTQGTTNTITSVQKDNLVVIPELKKIDSLYEDDNDAGRIYSSDQISTTIKSEGGGLGAKTGLYETQNRIRRLTPLECFRLQGFPDEFFYKAKYESLEKSQEILLKFPKHKGKRMFFHEERIERMSDSQLYRQAGNTITVNVLKAIFKNLLV